jgi:hypothetical protein
MNCKKIKSLFTSSLAIVTITFCQPRSTAMAQGVAVILPMSEAVYSADETINFTMHSQTEGTSVLSIESRCEVDGKELAGAECDQFFDIQFIPPQQKNEIKIPRETPVKGQVSLKNKAIRFGLFKPIFAPITNMDSDEAGAAFQFKYQPGYLFVPKPVEQAITKVDFKTAKRSDTLVALFDLDLSTMTMPSVASISAKILDPKKGTTIRFARLASNKILDPSRKKIALEAEVGSGDQSDPICYELVIQWIGTRQVQKLNGC